ncbi:energy transducer TonB [Ramlibacter sp. AN1133]|uniref:energy transducer TonB n=1 Tax=Ramlibacter sp. AN1133 TaxID=3133429 RepID=UPI0030BFA7FB
MPVSRNALIAGSVVLLHVGALWALQSGLLRRVVETVVPVEILAADVPPPPPPARVEPPRPPEPRPVVPQPRTIVRKSMPTPAPAPQPVAAPQAPPSPTAVTGTTEPQPAPPPVSTPVAAAPVAAPAPVAPAKVELPVSDADYLQNPAPEYPRMSRRLRESGLVVVRVLIGTDGRPRTAQVAQSSGFPRLDEASVETALAWRYVPGKRGGVPEEMWASVPIRWRLDNDGEKKP